MIISRTPFRVSFFGGGTDYPAWYHGEPGAVLSTTIDKYCYISCRVLPPFFSLRHRVVWSHIETVASVAEILHPAIREGLRFLGFDDTVGLEIQHQGDLPARTGMGSSSAFAVGLINALTALRCQMISKQDLARKAIELEQEHLKENVGCQDSVAAAHGGFNIIRFTRDSEIQVQPVTVSPTRLAELESRLLLVYTGTPRFASAIAADVVANMKNRGAHLRRMRSMVDEAVGILNGGDNLDEFGRLLHENWMLKRELSPSVSTETIDTVYQTAIEQGALGGKLLGAGGSGFMVFYVPPDRAAAVVRALPTCLHVPFRFEREGSTILYYSIDGTLKPGSVGVAA